MNRRVYLALILLLLAGLLIVFQVKQSQDNERGSDSGFKESALHAQGLDKLKLSRIGSKDESSESEESRDFLSTSHEYGLYYEGKQEFYENLNLSPDEFKRKRRTAHPDNPLFKFYINRLKAEDQAVVNETLRLFASSLAPRDDWDLNDEVAQDATELGAVFHGLGTLAPYVKTKNFAYRELYDLVRALSPHLESDDEERRSDALTIVNAATFGVYEGRTPEWWSSEFSKSTLAEVFLGTHPSVLDHSDVRTVLNVVKPDLEGETENFP